MEEERKDKKKMKYEQPRLVKLNTDAGEGQYDTGSGAMRCQTGTIAD